MRWLRKIRWYREFEKTVDAARWLFDVASSGHQFWRAMGAGRQKFHIVWKTMDAQSRRRFVAGFRLAMSTLYWKACVRGAPCTLHLKRGWHKRRIEFLQERFVVRYLVAESGPLLVVVDHVPTWRRKSGTAPWDLAHQMAGALVDDLFADLMAVDRGELPAAAGIFAPPEEREP